MNRNPVKLKARIEKKWVLSVNGVDIPMRFEEEQEMAGMALLVDEDNNSLVVDVPYDFRKMMSDLMGLEEEFEVTVIKSSRSVSDAVKAAYKEVAVKVAEVEDKENERPAEELQTEPPAETEPSVEDKPEQMESIEVPEEKGDGNNAE